MRCGMSMVSSMSAVGNKKNLEVSVMNVYRASLFFAAEAHDTMLKTQQSRIIKTAAAESFIFVFFNLIPVLFSYSAGSTGRGICHFI